MYVRNKWSLHFCEVFGGEVDCCEGSKDHRNYIELKTSREMDTPNQFRNFKRLKEFNVIYKFLFIKYSCEFVSI